MLQLLQLSDSALPIGSMAHSFGLETLAFDGDVEDKVESCPASLSRYVEDLLDELLMLDGTFCREAHARGINGSPVCDLNQELSALRLARESREGSLALGRRFAALAAALHPGPELSGLAQLDELHHAVAFGYVFGVLRIDADLTVSSFLHQNVLNIISAAQRLFPLGQIQANRIAWNLKPAILNTVAKTGRTPFSEVCAFAHVPEMASMRHCSLPTRLFIS